MKKKHNEVLVGMFVIFGFVFLSLIVFFVSGVYLFRPGYSVDVMYEYVSILDKGAPIRMAGVRIGEVSKVDLVFDEALKKTRVRVKLFIEKGVEIRENYLFKIQGTHILSEPHIEITPVPGDSPLIKPGELIEGETPVPLEALIDKSNSIADHLESVLGGLRTAVQDKETAQDIKDIVRNLATLTDSMNKVLSGSEKDLKDAITHIKSSTESLSIILDKMEKGEGTAGKLLTQDELYQEMRAFVAEIKAHPWRLMKKDGGGRKFLLF